MHKKTTLSAVIGLALSGAALHVNASLTSSTVLQFTLGSTTDPDCPLCPHAFTDIYGSYFAIDTNGNGVENSEKIPIGSFNGIHIGSIQAASGSHTGAIDGSENPNIDLPWTFFGATGMHQTTSPITDLSGAGSIRTLDFSGWGWSFNGIANVPMTDMGTTITCDTTSCSDTSSYTIDGAFHMNGAAFTTAPYYLHLEGTISNVPIPAAVWLVGSGLLGLVGIASRKKAS